MNLYITDTLDSIHQTLDPHMNYRCPGCETNLGNRYMPTKWLGGVVVRLPYSKGAVIRRPVAVCPKCNTPLSVNTHPFDQALVRWAPLPLVLFFAGLFLDSMLMKVISGAVLVLGAAWSAWVITRPSYKEWRYWRVHADHR